MISLLATLSLLPSSAARADDNPMVGKWRGSNGVTFTIPAGAQDFQLVNESADHKKITFQAHWVKKGAEFSWTDKQGTTHSATFDSKYKSPRIRDINPDYPGSPAYWYKIP